MTGFTVREKKKSFLLFSISKEMLISFSDNFNRSNTLLGISYLMIA